MLLCKRPAKGIWGSLYCLPEVMSDINQKKAQLFCKRLLGKQMMRLKWLDSFRHTFTHYHLNALPGLVEVRTQAACDIFVNQKDFFKPMVTTQQIWYNLQDPPAFGLPKPILVLLEGLKCI